MNLIKIAGLVALVAICCMFSACGTVHYKSTDTVEPAKGHGHTLEGQSVRPRLEKLDLNRVGLASLVERLDGDGGHDGRDEHRRLRALVGFLRDLEGSWLDSHFATCVLQDQIERQSSQPRQGGTAAEPECINLAWYPAASPPVNGLGRGIELELPTRA